MNVASALPVPPQTARRAADFLAALRELYGDALFASLTTSPTIDGAIAAVWAAGDRRVELVFFRDRIEYSVDAGTAVLEDGETRVAARVLRKVVHPYVTALWRDSCEERRHD